MTLRDWLPTVTPRRVVGAFAFGSLLLCCSAASATNTAHRVTFDRERYHISPGETYPVRIVITPPPAAGLDSFGVEMAIPSAHASLASGDPITVPPSLRYNGVRGSGNITQSSSSSASVKGTIDFSGSSNSYSGAPLATFTLTDKAPGPYLLRLAPFNTLGPTEQIFVDGAGMVLDSVIEFGQALVNYKPEVMLVVEGGQSTFPAGAPITFTAEAGDLDGAISKIELFRGDVKLAESTSNRLYHVWENTPPGTHIFKALATDELGGQGASSNVIVLVLPPNDPPNLRPIDDLVMDEGSLLQLLVDAQDANAPPQELRFSLGSGAPDGAGIDSLTGLFSWTPGESHGPGEYSVAVTVTDNGVPPLSSSQSFKIFVNEVNQPPLLGLITDKTATVGETLTFVATATDPDLPMQHLEFFLEPDAPADSTIDSRTGAFSWTVSGLVPGASRSLTVRVVDDGVPPLSDTQTFRIRIPNGSYALFAGQADMPAGKGVVTFAGSSNSISGRIHSNSDIVVAGNKATFQDSEIEHVTGVVPSPNFANKAVLIRSAIIPASVKDYPVNFQLEDFAPGGRYASQLSAQNKYYHVKGDTDLKDVIRQNALPEGLYFVEGKVHLAGKGLTGRVTIVATDTITITANGALLFPAVECLLAFSPKQTDRFDKPSIRFSGNGLRFYGTVFSPNGGIQITGNEGSFLAGSLVGLGVTFAGTDFRVHGNLPGCEPFNLASKTLRLSPTIIQAALSSTIENGRLLVSFDTHSGHSYILEWAESLEALSSDHWQQGTTVQGDGLSKRIPFNISAPQRFYRLRIVPAEIETPAP